MKIVTLVSVALFLMSTNAFAGEIASRFICTDGTIIRLDTSGPRMTVTWKGNSLPVDGVTPTKYGVNITAGIKNKSAAILDPLWLDNPLQVPFYATFSLSPSADTTSVQCNPDRNSDRLQF